MVGLPCLGEFLGLVPQKERENAETLKDQPAGTRRPTFFLIWFVKESIHCSCPFRKGGCGGFVGDGQPEMTILNLRKKKSIVVQGGKPNRPLISSVLIYKALLS